MNNVFMIHRLVGGMVLPGLLLTRRGCGKVGEGKKGGSEKGAGRHRGQYRPVTASTGEEKRPVLVTDTCYIAVRYISSLAALIQS
ncbi:MAG TPA: hypothetical protein VF707_03775 [Ardenticatenaceae bacterium]|jgi:hypothetical protein